jgi:localization factor PodJL
MGCCCKILCDGCDYANRKRDDEQGLQQRCAFCREPLPKSEEEYEKRLIKRIKKNDPVAMTQMGETEALKGEYGKALQYHTNAAELGDVLAYYRLGNLYDKGNGVEEDTKKAVYHWEQAAIGGHPGARGFLASEELRNERPDRAAKHLMIAANLGHHESLKGLMTLYKHGHASKEDYASALRAYQAAIDEMKSPEREAAEKALS